ncbi:cingulin [Drosophila grimshawi]|uniref:GH20278 n=1 Tax=Drosophila grimshawi TaxID=7222 RepID=B4J5C0_DROGR|nr:cingulin [Drosophila grimshawi]EDW01762.1 GH20278 [Drosophila grimshawi]
MDTESEQPTNVGRTSSNQSAVNPENVPDKAADEAADVAADEAADEFQELDHSETPVDPREASTLTAVDQPDRLSAQATQPQTEEEKKAERRARLKQNRYQRFTINDEFIESAQDEIIQIEEQKLEDEEQAELKENESDSSVGRSKKVEESDVETAMHGMMAEDVEVDEILFTDEEEDEDEDVDNRGPAKNDAIGAKANFLMNFEFPSLSDISEEQEIVEVEHMTEAVSSQHRETKGKFVHPLRRESSSSSSHDTVPVAVPVTAIVADDHSESDEESETETDDSLDFNDSIFDIKTPAADEEDVIDVFVKFQASHIDVIPFEESADVVEARKLKQEALQIAIDFLNELFDNVVNKVENVNEEYILRNKFDKLKLQEKLAELRDKLMYEKELCTYLNMKMCDYYKRMKNVRVFSTLPGDIYVKEKQRYLNALMQLDYVKSVAAETKKKNAILMSSVLMDLTHVQNIVMYTEEHFEELMVRTLCTNKSDLFKRIIERELRQMSQKRNEISDDRLYLISRKHTLGRITDKITKLEQINEDLCMDDFINIQNQVAALDKKIEERNNDLKKLRLNYHTELHLTQHNREKALALDSKLDVAKLNLEIMQKKQDQLRECLYKAKLERSNIRKVHSDLSFQGGLLSMPALMFDYDETVERVRAKQASVKELKETFKHITQRILELETRIT